MHKPLEGVRVLEWAIFHAGPGAAAILGDLGAEVIKIEQPEIGDPLRQTTRYKDIDFHLPGNRNLFFEGSNRGKKGITLNLAVPEGRQIAYNLVSKCDIFCTNLRQPTIELMRMDYETLSKVNPRLVYASVTGYGPLGPDANEGGFDYQGQGRSGLMYNIGEPGMPPLAAQFAVIDQSTAIMASYQMVIAFLMRERLGIGQKVDVSILGTASYILYFNNLIALVTGRQIPRHQRASADPLRNYYKCKDEKWLVQSQPAEENWGLVCRLLSHPGLEHDPRFATKDKRFQNSKELVLLFEKIFATRPRDEWLDTFRGKGMIMCAVNTTEEAVKDPQMTANSYIVETEHPDLGHIRIPGFPARFSHAETNHVLAAPRLGEHTEEVLRTLGGYSTEEIARFRQDKIT